MSTGSPLARIDLAARRPSTPVLIASNRHDVEEAAEEPGLEPLVEEVVAGAEHVQALGLVVPGGTGQRRQDGAEVEMARVVRRQNVGHIPRETPVRIRGAQSEVAAIQRPDTAQRGAVQCPVEPGRASPRQLRRQRPRRAGRASRWLQAQQLQRIGHGANPLGGRIRHRDAVVRLDEQQHFDGFERIESQVGAEIVFRPQLRHRPARQSRQRFEEWLFLGRVHGRRGPRALQRGLRFEYDPYRGAIDRTGRRTWQSVPPHVHHLQAVIAGKFAPQGRDVALQSLLDLGHIVVRVHAWHHTACTSSVRPLCNPTTRSRARRAYRHKWPRGRRDRRSCPHR